MGPYCLDPKIACEGKEPIYDLIGVVNHMGSMVSPSNSIQDPDGEIENSGKKHF